ncbi:unnamed protein product [Arabidopsis lyrata]|nr:unnamed protein product [Arabidopsis lyrata]
MVKTSPRRTCAIGSGIQERLARVPRAVLFEYPEAMGSGTPRRLGLGIPNVVSGYPRGDGLGYSEAIGLGYPQCRVRVPSRRWARALRGDWVDNPGWMMRYPEVISVKLLRCSKSGSVPKDGIRPQQLAPQLVSLENQA